MKEMGVITDRTVNVGGFADARRKLDAFRRTKVHSTRKVDSRTNGFVSVSTKWRDSPQPPPACSPAGLANLRNSLYSNENI
jgi:hypothetical protein